MRGWAAAAVVAASGIGLVAAAADKPSRAGAEERIEAQRKADEKACRKLKGLARDVCRAQAEGRERVALAKLEAKLNPTPEAEQAAKEAQAEADYEVALERCRGVAEDARKSCRRDARHKRDAAIRLAKIEKVQREQALKDDRGEQRARTEKEAYASRKAYCHMQGPQRDACLAELDRRFGRS